MSMSDRWLRVAEVAEILSICERTVRKLVAVGELNTKFIRTSRRGRPSLRVSLHSVEALGEKWKARRND